MERLHAYVDVCITMYYQATNVKLAYLIAFSIYIFFLNPKCTTLYNHFHKL